MNITMQRNKILKWKEKIILKNEKKNVKRIIGVYGSAVKALKTNHTSVIDEAGT